MDETENKDSYPPNCLKVWANDTRNFVEDYVAAEFTLAPPHSTKVKIDFDNYL